jgi:hypothetical protein
VPSVITYYKRGRGYKGNFGFINKVKGQRLSFNIIKASIRENYLVKAIREPLAS